MTALFRDTNEEVAAVFTRLKRGNPGLNTEMWKVWEAKPVGKSLQLILGVDERSAAELTKVDFAPYFGLGRARFHEVQPKTVKGKQALVGRGTGKETLVTDKGKGKGASTKRPPAENTKATADEESSLVEGGKGGEAPIGEPECSAATLIPQTSELIRPPRLTLERRASEGGSSKEKAGRPSMAALAIKEALDGTREGTQSTLTSFILGSLSSMALATKAKGEAASMEVEDGH
ncbi:hypothetical protein PV325_003580 [Microctonus aethiopoides]|uniref:DUF4780 domain-containing protein n=1 Tax=Microctonus aethiopoides TaxID=144406 RepID=A0AA39FW14_9HYME|nr:hypothetical protein PV325_003580 [Microctonus aethiopoides]KAK0088538.1 hypothetical protein PV326_004805 [Microctonus aethiopoides]KAK0176894.1 hypothetical protein PV328_000992 [Microctonus aethiopoides]